MNVSFIICKPLNASWQTSFHVDSLYEKGLCGVENEVDLKDLHRPFPHDLNH